MHARSSFARQFGLHLGSWLCAAAGFGQVPEVAPLNPEFVRYFQLGLMVEEANYGLIPYPVDLSYLGGQEVLPEMRVELATPPSYDLRTLGKVTPVRNQGFYATCWAHATFGSMESALLPCESLDFSENNLVNLDGFDRGFNDGGNFFMSMAYLAGWSGPVSEAEDPYPNPSGSPTGLTVRKHAQQMRIIPGKSGPTANDAIKQAVMDGGAVYASYYHENSCFNATHNAYHYSGWGWDPGNHAVTLVGWDDDFDRNKFNSIPAGDGAYIVKNSWGEGWGESGYYYVSYYDSKFGYEPMCVFHDADTPDNYAGVYAYDPLGWVTNLGVGTPMFWGANLFTASADGELGAVGFFANSLNTGYTIRVHNGVSAGDPGSGTLVATQTGTSAYPGFRTISLDTPVALTAGERFSIVIQLTTPGYNYPQPIEFVIAGYSSAASAAAGQSFYSEEGTRWTDLATWNTTANFCIKGFTVMQGSPEIAIEEPAETDLCDGVSAVAFEAVTLGGGALTKVFTIKSAGPRFLKCVRVLSDGVDATDYVVDTTRMSPVIAPGSSTTFSVTFRPVGAVSRTAVAALHIVSNDEDESPFDIALTGQAFSTTADCDQDGMSDWAEYRLALLGFDWQVGQSEMVEALFENANLAGLFTEAQVHALHLDTPLLARDPVTGRFALTLGLRKSTDLSQWSEFPFTNPGTTINSEGKVEFNFAAPDQAAFYRLEAR